MIIIDIPDDDAGQSHYEVLGLDPKTLASLTEGEITKKVRNATKKARQEFTKAAQKGDEEANTKLQLLNDAESTLKEKESRTKYDEALKSGRGAVLDVLRIQPISPPFFRDRAARFRALERMMRAAGLSQPIPYRAR